MARKFSGADDSIEDQEILESLEESRIAFNSGDKSALMRCVFCCAAYQAVIPDWAADALIALRGNIENGRVKNFNEAFESNKPVNKVNTRAARVRQEKAKPEVMAEILRLRVKGISFNDAEMFSQVVDNLRVRGFNVNHRDVKSIYQQNVRTLKAIPRGPGLEGNYAIGDIEFPKIRVKGRSILEE